MLSQTIEPSAYGPDQSRSIQIHNQNCPQSSQTLGSPERKKTLNPNTYIPLRVTGNSRSGSRSQSSVSNRPPVKQTLFTNNTSSSHNPHSISIQTVSKRKSSLSPPQNSNKRNSLSRVYDPINQNSSVSSLNKKVTSNRHQ